MIHYKLQNKKKFYLPSIIVTSEYYTKMLYYDKVDIGHYSVLDN